MSETLWGCQRAVTIRDVNERSLVAARRRSGIIETLLNEIEDREWTILRARHDIKAFEKAIKELRQKSADKRKAKR